MINGIGVSPGIAIAKPLVLRSQCAIPTLREIEDPKAEINRLNAAIRDTRERMQTLRSKCRDKGDEEILKILSVHLSFLDDPELIDRTLERIYNMKYSCEYALSISLDEIEEELAEIDDLYIRERISDIRDVGGQIIARLMEEEGQDISYLDDEVVLVAEDIEPSQLIAADKEKVVGLICEKGGITSHTAIIAKNRNIPAVFGVPNARILLEECSMILIDGYKGQVKYDLTSADVEEAKKEAHVVKDLRESLVQYASRPGITKDGRNIPVRSNIGNYKDALYAKEMGAQGIGLFRTEYLFMDRSTLPTEDEQYEVYRSVLELFPNDPVTIRTLDAGGDKKFSSLSFCQEDNPFLGLRAIRLCLAEKDLFRTQLRALLRASPFGNLKIMFPMISGIEELREANQIFDRVRKELKLASISFKEYIPVGIMIEVPSAAICSDLLIQETDFFSIGSNDLTQYTLAADRNNPAVATLCSEYNLAVLRLIQLTAKNAALHNKKVSLCGELGGDVLATRLLLSLGIDEFSMNVSSMNKIKKMLSLTSSVSVKNLFSRFSEETRTPYDVRMLLEEDIRELGYGSLLSL